MHIEIYEYNIPITSKEFLKTNVISGIFQLNIALEYFSGILLSNILQRIFEEGPNVQVLHLGFISWLCASTGTKYTYMLAMPASTHVYPMANMPYMLVFHTRIPPITLNFTLCVVNIVHLSRSLACAAHPCTSVRNAIYLHWHIIHSGAYWHVMRTTTYMVYG